MSSEEPFHAYSSIVRVSIALCSLGDTHVSIIEYAVCGEPSTAAKRDVRG